MKFWLFFNMLVITCIAVTGYECDEPLVYHQKSGFGRCCSPVTCPKGEQPEMCSHNGRSASCRPCNEGYYMPNSTSSWLMRTCRRKLECYEDYGLIEVDYGGTVKDRKCGCNLQKSFYDPDHGQCKGNNCPLACAKKACAAGMESNESGQCCHCRLGFYKAHAGYERCIEQKHCVALGLKVLVPGNTTHDNECSNRNETYSGTTVPLPHTNATPAPMGSSKNINNENATIWIVVVVPVAVVLLVILGVVLITRKRCFERKKADRNGTSKLLSRDNAEISLEKTSESVNLSRRPSNCSILAPDPGPMEDPATYLLHDDGSLNYRSETERKNFESSKFSCGRDSGIDGNITRLNSELEEDAPPSDSPSMDSAGSCTVDLDSAEETAPKEILTEEESISSFQKTDHTESDARKECTCEPASAKVIYSGAKDVYIIKGHGHNIHIGDGNLVHMNQKSSSLDQLNSGDSGFTEVVESKEADSVES